MLLIIIALTSSLALQAGGGLPVCNSSVFLSMTFSFHYSNLHYILRKRGWYGLDFIIIIIIIFFFFEEMKSITKNSKRNEAFVDLDYLGSHIV